MLKKQKEREERSEGEREREGGNLQCTMYTTHGFNVQKQREDGF